MLTCLSLLWRSKRILYFGHEAVLTQLKRELTDKKKADIEASNETNGIDRVKEYYNRQRVHVGKKPRSKNGPEGSRMREFDGKLSNICAAQDRVDICFNQNASVIFLLFDHVSIHLRKRMHLNFAQTSTFHQL
jgi:hypothetical protein